MGKEFQRLSWFYLTVMYLLTILLLVGYLLGPCRSCPCPDDGPAMCGSDDGGVTFKNYKNTCHVWCERAEVYCEGTCPCKEREPMGWIWDKISRVLVGSCPRRADCVCITLWDPVCGYNPDAGRFQTYSNRCWADCDCAEDISNG